MKTLITTILLIASFSVNAQINVFTCAINMAGAENTFTLPGVGEMELQIGHIPTIQYNDSTFRFVYKTIDYCGDSIRFVMQTDPEPYDSLVSGVLYYRDNEKVAFTTVTNLEFQSWYCASMNTTPTPTIKTLFELRTMNGVLINSGDNLRELLSGVNSGLYIVSENGVGRIYKR